VRGSTPIPDPTLLTTEALQREIAGLKEFLLAKLSAEIDATRLRFETVDVKFDGVKNRFTENDEHTKSLKTADTTALNAALAAQEKAASEQNNRVQIALDKSDVATSKRFDEQRTLLETVQLGLNDKFNELRDRQTRAETQASTQRDTKVDRQVSGGYVAGYIFGAAGAMIGIAGLLIALLKH
jgi:hypothetical protein